MQAEVEPAALVDDPMAILGAVEMSERDRRVGRHMRVEQVEHAASGLGEGSVRGGRDGRGSFYRSGVHTQIIGHWIRFMSPGALDMASCAVQMRLATFLAPGAVAPAAGEVRGAEVVAFAEGSVRDRLASGDRSPADGTAYPLDDVTLLAPVPRPRAIFGIGLNYARPRAETGASVARAADRVHEAADVRDGAGRADRLPARSSGGWTTRASWRW